MRIDAAIQDWNDRVEREHGLDSDGVEALEPYVRYLYHYGRGLDLAVAAVVSGAWIVTMSAAVLYRVLVFDPTASAVALYGGAATVGFDVLTLALPMLGLVGALYWMRRAVQAVHRRRGDPEPSGDRPIATPAPW
jgi:hypothetical protein